MTGQVKVDHAAMSKVADRLDKLIAELGNSGIKGTYANMQGAAELAYAVQSIGEPEIGPFVQQYNIGFGAAANDYRALADIIVSIRNAVALTANNHAANEQAQVQDFKPLQGGDGLQGGKDGNQGRIVHTPPPSAPLAPTPAPTTSSING